MKRYVVRARARFEAAHHLHSYKGTPEPVHGHSWQVEAAVVANRLDEEGMAFDFVELQRHLEELAGRYHHGNLNEIAPFERITPSAENLAEWFFHELEERCREARLLEVTVWEGPGCSATFSLEPGDHRG